MKRTLALTSLLAGALAASAYSYHSLGVVAAPQGGGLAPSGTLDRSAFQAPSLDDRAAWSAALGEADLARREARYEALISTVRGTRGGLAALERWAAEEEDASLAWTLRLALRELRASRDPFAPWFQGSASPWGGAWPDFDTLLPDGLLRPDWPDLLQPAPAAPGARSSSKSVQIQMGPDGVHVEVTEDVDGEEVVNEYDGATLDELLETYPELREHVDATGGFGFGGGLQRGAPFDWRAPGLRTATPWWGPGTDPGGAGAPRTDVLGVYVRAEVGDAFAHVERPEGVGLAVDGVAPGTIAAALGIDRGALLLELGDRQLRSRDDISAVLGAREPEEPLRAVWVDAAGARHEETWTPSSASRRARWSGNLRRM